MSESSLRGVAVLSGLKPPTTASSLGRTVRVGDVSFQMVAVQEGAFLMGASDDDAVAMGSEKPRHEVHLSGYQIGQTQVTQGLYTAIMGNNPSHNPASDQHPVENVSWFDAVRFCNALSQACGLDAAYLIGEGDPPSVTRNVSAPGFRLPTEAEWECAARAGQDLTYSGADDPDEVAWFNENSDTTHPVARKAPNAWGLYDMSGNVREWCWDRYGSQEYARRVRQAHAGASWVHDPSGPQDGVHRILRGGGFLIVSRSRRVAGRSSGAPASRFRSFGLRLAMSSGPLSDTGRRSP